MSRKSPEQIESSIRENARRAMRNVVIGLGSLIGIGAAVTAYGAHEIHIAQVAIESHLMPESAKQSQEPQAVKPASQQKDGNANQPPVVFQLKADSARQAHEPPTGNGGSSDWLIPLGAIGGSGALSVGGLMVLERTAQRRRKEEDEANEDDIAYVESAEDYGLYPFERRAFDTQEAFAMQVDELDDRLATLEAGAAELTRATDAALITARLHSELNLRHLAVLASMEGRNPLEALTYSSQATYEAAQAA